MCPLTITMEQASKKRGQVDHLFSTGIPSYPHYVKASPIPPLIRISYLCQNGDVCSFLLVYGQVESKGFWSWPELVVQWGFAVSSGRSASPLVTRTLAP